MNYKKHNTQLKKITDRFDKDINELYDSIWKDVISFCKKYHWTISAGMGLFYFYKIYTNSYGADQELNHEDYLNTDIQFSDNGNESCILEDRFNSQEYQEIKKLIDFLEQDPTDIGVSIGCQMGDFDPRDPGSEEDRL